MIEIKVNTKDLEKKLDKLKDIDKIKILKGIGIIVSGNVIKQVNQMQLVDNGTFKNSITFTLIGNNEVLVHDGVTYGKYLEFGTRPHLIKPKNKKALSFKIEGKSIITKLVKHPGFKAFKPFEKGILASIDEINEFILQSIINLTK